MRGSKPLVKRKAHENSLWLDVMIQIPTEKDEGLCCSSGQLREVETIRNDLGEKGKGGS